MNNHVKCLVYKNGETQVNLWEMKGLKAYFEGYQCCFKNDYPGFNVQCLELFNPDFKQLFDSCQSQIWTINHSMCSTNCIIWHSQNLNCFIVILWP